jgi:hypothetical protein
MANATSNSGYWIPASEENLRREFLRVINARYSDKFMLMNYDLNTYYDKIIEDIQTKFFHKNAHLSQVHNHPLLISLENKLNAMSLENLRGFDEESTLGEKLSSLALFDTKQLLSSERNKEIQNKFISKFANELFLQFRNRFNASPEMATWDSSAQAVVNFRDSVKKYHNRDDTEFYSGSLSAMMENLKIDVPVIQND